MEISSRILSRQLLFALLLLIGPMMLFPELLGTEIKPASAINFLIEIFVYAIAVFAMNLSFRLAAVSKAVIFCLIVRVILGVCFGLLISVMYALSPSVALTLGITGYLPAIILHVLSTPFLVQPFVVQFGPAPVLDLKFDPSSAEKSKMGRTTFAASKSLGKVSEQGVAEPAAEAVAKPEVEEPPSQAGAKVGVELSGFERATRYLGEDGSVYFAGVVDAEGLLMANFKRREAVPEDWAPLSLMLLEVNAATLKRGHLYGLTKTDLTLEDKRVIVAFESGYHLMVVADQSADDILNVRINQALEIVRKYVEERYPVPPLKDPENKYV